MSLNVTHEEHTITIGPPKFAPPNSSSIATSKAEVQAAIALTPEHPCAQCQAMGEFGKSVKSYLPKTKKKICLRRPWKLNLKIRVIT